MKTKQTARFQIGDLVGIGVAFVVIGITLGLGATVMAQVLSTQLSSNNVACDTGGSGFNCSIAANSSKNGLSALNTLSGYLPILGTVAAAAVVIGIVMRYLAGGHE